MSPEIQTPRSLEIVRFAVSLLKANLDEHSEFMDVEPPPTEAELEELHQQLEEAIAKKGKMDKLDLTDIGLDHYSVGDGCCYIREPGGPGMTSDEYDEIRDESKWIASSQSAVGVIVQLHNQVFDTESEVLDSSTKKLMVICDRIKQHGFKEVCFE